MKILTPTVKTILKRRLTQAGIGILGFYVVMLAFGPYLTHYPPEISSGPPNSSPSYSHPFGTDFLGKDIFSQMIWGAYPSLTVGILSALGAVLLGFIVGLFSGYFDRVDGPLIGLTDIVMTIPSIPLLILLGSIAPVTNAILIFLFVAVLWPPVAHAVRSQVLSVKRWPFIEAAKLSGRSDMEVVGRVVAPQVAPIALAYFVLIVPLAIILVTGLQFIGVGNPLQVGWGSVLFWAQRYAFLDNDWWWILIPGMAIVVLALGFAFVGFAIEEVANPRLRV